jgi:hypothetical protein
MCETEDLVFFVYYINSKIVSTHKPATPKNTIYPLLRFDFLWQPGIFLSNKHETVEFLFLTVIIISSVPEKSNWEILISILWTPKRKLPYGLYREPDVR